MNLGNKIGAVVLMVGVVMLSILFVFTWRFVTGEISEVSGDEQMAAGKFLMNSIDKMMFERMADIKVNANSVAFENVLIDKTASESALTRANLELSQIKQAYGVWDELLLVGTDGVVVAGSEQAAIGVKSDEIFEGLSNYLNITDSGEFYTDHGWSNYLNRNSKAFGRVVLDDNREAVGYLVGLLSWQSIHELMDSLNFVAVLVDKQGKYLEGNHRFEEANSSNRDGQNYLTFIEEIPENFYVENDGVLLNEPSVTALITEPGYLDYGGNEWRLIIEEPLSSSTGVVGEIVEEYIIVLATLSTLAMGVIILAIRSLVVKRVEKLNSLVGKFSSGVFEERFEDKSHDEIGELARSFNQMASELSSMKSGLESTVEERTDDLQKVKLELERQKRALINVLQDMSDEKKYVQTQSQSLLENMSEGIVITDNSGRVTFVNPAFEKLFGYTNLDLKDKDFADSLKAFDLKGNELPAELRSDAAAVTAKDNHLKIAYLSKSGEKVMVQVGASPIYVDQEFRGVVRMIHDIGEDVALQQKKDDFFSIASHELRTPLTVIAGNLDMLRSGYGGVSIEGEAKDVLEDSCEATDRLITMVNTFLNVSRLDQGRVKMNLTEFDIYGLLREVLGEYRQFVEKKGLQLVDQVGEGELKIVADADKVREIVINLLGNSTKFTSEGQIGVRTEIGADKLRIIVFDTGSGIEADKQGLLFGRFQQAMNRTLSREAGGTGLGLYISREFAKLMGGNLNLISSEPGKGSEFCVELPLTGVRIGQIPNIEN